MKIPRHIALKYIGNNNFCKFHEALNYLNNLSEYPIFSWEYDRYPKLYELQRIVVSRKDLIQYFKNEDLDKVIEDAKKFNIRQIWEIVLNRDGISPAEKINYIKKFSEKSEGGQEHLLWKSIMSKEITNHVKTLTSKDQVSLLGYVIPSELQTIILKNKKVKNYITTLDAKQIIITCFNSQNEELEKIAMQAKKVEYFLQTLKQDEIFELSNKLKSPADEAFWSYFFQREMLTILAKINYCEQNPKLWADLLSIPKEENLVKKYIKSLDREVMKEKLDGQWGKHWWPTSIILCTKNFSNKEAVEKAINHEDKNNIINRILNQKKFNPNEVIEIIKEVSDEEICSNILNNAQIQKYLQSIN